MHKQETSNSCFFIDKRTDKIIKSYFYVAVAVFLVSTVFLLSN
ncbi:MAG TPA: hypothetical protein PLH37_01655 [bacterium]|nr:hypothetical protein [bacterium]